jgi:uncharacterized protein (DUF1697 family)
VNLGSHNKVPMAELRKVVESLGHTEVQTLIASGNVVFTSAKAIQPSSLEKAIEAAFKIDIAVMLRTAAEMKRVVKAVPFKSAELASVHVGFMQRKPPAATVSKLDREKWLPEAFAFKNAELYLHLPNGMGRTKLVAYLDRQLKIPTTIRTWKTVMKLLELMDP